MMKQYTDIEIEERLKADREEEYDREFDSIFLGIKIVFFIFIGTLIWCAVEWSYKPLIAIFFYMPFFLFLGYMFHSFFFTGIIYRKDENGNMKRTDW